MNIKPFYAIALVITMVLTMSLSCEKDNNDNPTTNVTRFTLMSNNGKAWYIREVKQTWLNASGGIDSTNKTPVSGFTQVMWFGDNAGVNGLNEVYYALEPLNHIVPTNGIWVLNEATQVLTLNCFGASCSTTKDGDWKIIYYKQSVYGETIRLERTTTLTGGRKVSQYFELSK